MKKLLLILVLFASLSFAEDKNALGLWVSNYGSGFDFKHLNNDNTVWDIYLGSGLLIGDRGLTSIGLDAGYYFLKPKVIKADPSSAGRFPIHYGPNFGFGYWGDGERPHRTTHWVIAPNCAVGISWFPPTSFKWDLSFELFPGLRIYHNSYELENVNKWDSETYLGLGVDFRLLIHAYFF